MTQEMQVQETTLMKQPQEYQGLMMHCSPKESLRRMQELQAFIKEVMVPEIDYGIIPGTQKPTLLQPGAQKLCEMYGLSPDFVFEEKAEDWDKGFFYYRVKCILTDRRTGNFVGNGYGSCNSKEGRYAYRWLFENEIPLGIDKKTLVKQERYSTKKQKFYVQYRLPNDEICSLVNTIQKLGCKRALMHAVLGVTRSAGIFAQDLEDLPAEVVGQADEHRSWEHHNMIDVDPLPTWAGGSEQPKPEGVKADSLATETKPEPVIETNFAVLIEAADDLETLNQIRKRMLAELPAGDKRKALGAIWTARANKVQAALTANANPQTGEINEPGSQG